MQTLNPQSNYLQYLPHVVFDLSKSYSPAELDFFLERPGLAMLPADMQQYVGKIEKKNKDIDLAKYFSEGTRPVSVNEFFKFWCSLSVAERLYFQLCDLN